jgi:hypothetical protein
VAPVDVEQRSRERSGALTRWREPRMLLIGVCILAFAFAGTTTATATATTNR